MKSNRRSVLIGLGTLTVGGGAVFGTGAFSSVDADRSVSVTVADDSNALLGLSVEDSYNGISSPSGGQASFDFTDINENAVTEFDAALTVTNNGSEEVSVSVSDSPAAITFFEAGTENDISESGNEITIASEDPSATADIDIEIDLVDESAPSGDNTITISAESTQ